MKIKVKFSDNADITYSELWRIFFMLGIFVPLLILAIPKFAIIISIATTISLIIVLIVKPHKEVKK